MTDINLAAIEMYGCYQSVFIAANIENDPLTYSIGGGEHLSQFGKIAEFGLLHDLEPTL